MYYLVDNMSLNIWNIYANIEDIPEKYRDSVVQVESLPGGSGILRRAEDGTFYYEEYPPEPIDPPDPVPPEPTVEQRLERIELTSAQTQVQGDYVAFLVETLLAK